MKYAYYIINGLLAFIFALSIITSGFTDFNITGMATLNPGAVKVELFVMSYCPYGTQAEKGIIPVVELLGRDIDFKVEFVDYAMHGKKEIDENLRQYCIQKEQQDKFIDYLKCFLEDGDSENCLASAKINTAVLEACISKTDKKYNITEMYNDRSTWIGSVNKYPQFNIYKDLNDKYEVKGSPTLVINGQVVQSERSPIAFLNTICKYYENPPQACNLSSQTPSPGFGWSGSSSSGSASCE